MASAANKTTKTCSQEGPKRPPIVPQDSQRPPRSPKTAQKGPKIAQEGPQGLRQGSIRPLRAPRDVK